MDGETGVETLSCQAHKLSSLCKAIVWPHTETMNDIIIYINWEYFLGLLGTIIGLAYYANGRLTKVETSLEWLKDAVRELRVKMEQRSAP